MKNTTALLGGRNDEREPHEQTVDGVTIIRNTYQAAPDEIRPVRYWIERFDLPSRTVRRWLSRGALPSIQAGRERLVRLSDLLAMIDRGREEAPAKLAAAKPTAAESYTALVSSARRRRDASR